MYYNKYKVLVQILSVGYHVHIVTKTKSLVHFFFIWGEYFIRKNGYAIMTRANIKFWYRFCLLDTVLCHEKTRKFDPTSFNWGEYFIR